MRVRATLLGPHAENRRARQLDPKLGGQPPARLAILGRQELAVDDAVRVAKVPVAGERVVHGTDALQVGGAHGWWIWRHGRGLTRFLHGRRCRRRGRARLAGVLLTLRKAELPVLLRRPATLVLRCVRRRSAPRQRAWRCRERGSSLPCVLLRVLLLPERRVVRHVHVRLALHQVVQGRHQRDEVRKDSRLPEELLDRRPVGGVLLPLHAKDEVDVHLLQVRVHRISNRGGQSLDLRVLVLVGL